MFSCDYLHLDQAAKPIARDAVEGGAKAALTLLVAKDLLGKQSSHTSCRRKAWTLPTIQWMR